MVDKSHFYNEQHNKKLFTENTWNKKQTATRSAHFKKLITIEATDSKLQNLLRLKLIGNG